MASGFVELEIYKKLRTLVFINARLNIGTGMGLDFITSQYINFLIVIKCDRELIVLYFMLAVYLRFILAS